MEFIDSFSPLYIEDGGEIGNVVDDILLEFSLPQFLQEEIKKQMVKETYVHTMHVLSTKKITAISFYSNKQPGIPSACMLWWYGSNGNNLRVTHAFAKYLNI